MLWRDFIRNIGSGVGINLVGSTLKKEVDDSTVASATSDAAGLISFETNGHPGPVYHVETTGGQTKRRSSKAFGTVFPSEVPYALMAFPDGVTKGVDNELQAFGDSSGMQVKVKTGLALVKGHLYRCVTQQTIPVTANSSGNPRIDRVILRLTRPGQTEEGKFECLVLAGTPAGSPVAPTLTQSAATWEVSLAQVAVANGAATITSGNVTDERSYLQVADVDDVQTLSNKTLTSPTINTPTISGGAWTGGTDLAVADGGTGASSAAAARPNLGAAPASAKYVVQTADAELSAEQALGALATGLVKNTTATGVLSIAAQGTDYWAPGGTDVAVADGGTGASSAAAARTNLGLVIGTDVPPVASPTFTGQVSLSPHVAASGSAPTASIGAAAGAGATLDSISGNDTFCRVTLTTGGSGVTTGTLFTITWAGTRADANYGVWIAPKNTAARSSGAIATMGASGQNTTSCPVAIGITLATGTQYVFGIFAFDV